MSVQQESIYSQLAIPGPSGLQPTPVQHDDDDEFEDATDVFEKPSETMDLNRAFEDCERAIRKFFNNELVEAMDIMKPWEKTSLYHSLGSSIFAFIPAMLTFEQNQINLALTAIKSCMQICNQHRKYTTFVESIGTMIRKPNFGAYTDMEAHAELCYAEAMLLQAALMILDGEDLTGLIRGTIKVKSCYNSYKDCNKILQKKQWESETSKVHFESGVRLGLATFNLMISLLPPRIINLLEFVGFSGNKAYGLAELEASSKSPGLRSVLCDLTLMAYHLVICQFIGAEGDIVICHNILQNQLQVYPDGVWFLIFKGRLELLNGCFNDAIYTYNEAIVSQDVWRQFHHVCYWEIMWANCLKMKWREAADYAQKLIFESTWSRTIYSYVKVALLMQLNVAMRKEEKEECEELLEKAVCSKQRIAGKSLPMEKFIIKRSARFHAQGGRLLLPAIELLCLWNMFPILTRNERAGQIVLKMIVNALETVDNGPKEWMGNYEADNRALMRYLHGCLLANMGLPSLALAALDSVFLLKNDLKEDTFLLPYSLVEMAMCYHQLGQTEKGIQLLHDARKKYSGYHLESRLQFRIHSKMDILKNAAKPDAKNKVTQ